MNENIVGKEDVFDDVSGEVSESEFDDVLKDKKPTFAERVSNIAQMLRENLKEFGKECWHDMWK